MTTTKNNIAESCKSYYESKDFQDNYFEQLAESFHYDKDIIIDRIIDMFNVSNYETEKTLSNWFNISKEQAEKIYQFIADNLEDFKDTFNGYYVGYTSLGSVAFGEQEEQLTGFYDHKNNKPYNMAKLRKQFNDADYCINDSNPDYAYYIVSGGLHIDLLNNKQSNLMLNYFLLTIK